MNKKLIMSIAVTATVLGVAVNSNVVDAKARFRSCNEAWAAGYGNMRVGEDGYSAALDRDRDGVACEISGPSTNNGGGSTSATTVTTSGWQQSNGYWYYYVNGSVITGWSQINGTWYYFDSSGVMQTGWKSISGYWYYFDESGAMATGWKKISGYWYYFDMSGAMKTDWQKINGLWYYLNTSGEMQIGWKVIEGLWYYFDGSGAMVTSRWQGNYYLGQQGAMLINTITPDGYRVDASGLWMKETVPATAEPMTTTTTQTTSQM